MMDKVRDMLNKMMEKFGEVERHQQDMCQWRTEVTRRLAEPAVTSNNAALDESMNEQDEDLGWADRLTGTQTQATQQGAASLVSLFASPPPSGPDGKAGKGSGTIQGSATNTHSQAAQDQPEAVPNAEKAGASNAFDGPPARNTEPTLSRSASSSHQISVGRSATAEEDSHGRQASKQAGSSGR